MLPKDLQKVHKSRQILIRDKIAYVRASNFRPSPNFSAGATCAPVQLLPPWNLTKQLLKHSKRLPGCVWGHRGLFGTTWRRPLWWQVGTSWNNWKYLHLTWSSESGQLDITGTQYRRSARLLSTAAVPGTPTTSCRWTSATTTARTWRGGILENLDLEFQWRRRHWRQQTIVACHRHEDHAKATLSGDVFPF